MRKFDVRSSTKALYGKVGHVQLSLSLHMCIGYYIVLMLLLVSLLSLLDAPQLIAAQAGQAHLGWVDRWLSLDGHMSTVEM